MIDFADIIDIEKRTTAIFIPNAIQISTHQTKVNDHHAKSVCVCVCVRARMQGERTRRTRRMMACFAYITDHLLHSFHPTPFLVFLWFIPFT